MKAKAEEMLGRKLDKVRLVTDTTEFMQIDMGDVVELEGRRYLVKGTAHEGRFGLDDEPKHWVKTVLDWEDGSSKFLKFVFHEQFDLVIGQFKVRCFRSPVKEKRVLEKVIGHPHFMQGITLKDEVGNLVRVLDRVYGRPLDQIIDSWEIDHFTYQNKKLRGVLRKLLPAVAAIGELHHMGERHGDIRRDHLFVDSKSEDYRWIDFDYSFEQKSNPFGLDLFGLGNVICHVAGKGIPTIQEIKRRWPHLLDRLDQGDFSPVIPNRLFNLKKVYPHLPESLNNLLMHFSVSANVFYGRVDEILEDLQPVIEDLPRQ